MILLIDNYDSFVHNLARYFVRLGQSVRVVRNDAISVEEIRNDLPTAIVISPGPCTPAQAGNCEAIVRAFYRSVPILGVCLGHQAIATALGGELTRANEPVHGRTSELLHDGDALFSGLPSPLTVCRYHSLIVDEPSLPAELHITARTADGTPMALAHRELPVFGVQFHPEAILTQGGYELLANFLRLANLPTSGILPTMADERREAITKPLKATTTPVTF